MGDRLRGLRRAYGRWRASDDAQAEGQVTGVDIQREDFRRGRDVSSANCAIRPILHGGGVAMDAERSGRPWTVEAYLWLERNSLVKHEFVDETVYALAGGTRGHSRI